MPFHANPFLFPFSAYRSELIRSTGSGGRPVSSIVPRQVPPHSSSEIIPRATDIICGRGKSCISHPGNRKFIEVLRSNLERYKNAPKRIDKSAVVTDIVGTMRGRGVRYIKLRDDGETYFELNDEQAREKTGYAIRDLLKPRRRSKTSEAIMDTKALINSLLPSPSAKTTTSSMAKNPSEAKAKYSSLSENDSNALPSSLRMDCDADRGNASRRSALLCDPSPDTTLPQIDTSPRSSASSLFLEDEGILEDLRISDDTNTSSTSISQQEEDIINEDNTTTTTTNNENDNIDCSMMTDSIVSSMGVDLLSAELQKYQSLLDDFFEQTQQVQERQFQQQIQPTAGAVAASATGHRPLPLSDDSAAIEFSALLRINDALFHDS